MPSRHIYGARAKKGKRFLQDGAGGVRPPSAGGDFGLWRSLTCGLEPCVFFGVVGEQRLRPMKQTEQQDDRFGSFGRLVPGGRQEGE